MSRRFLIVWCFACAISFLTAGCGDDSADLANEDGLRFVIFDSADRSEYEPGVRVFGQDDQMELDSTAEFECKTGSLDLEQVRVAAFCQCLATLAEFLNADFAGDKTDDSTNVAKSSTSCHIGNFYVDTRTVLTEEEKSNLQRNRTCRSTTTISDGGSLSIVVRTTSEHDAKTGDSFESDVDMPLGFTVEKLLESLTNSGVSLEILYEQAEFDGFPMNSSARGSSDSKDVVSSVRQLLAKKGGICRYTVCIIFRKKGN